MPVDGRKLILEAAGGFLPGERVQQLLQRIVDETGLGLRSVECFWKGQYGSKNTVSKLQEKARNNADKAAKTIELACHLDALARQAPASDAEILRAAADTLRRGNLREG